MPVQSLSPYAARSEDHSRLHGAEIDHRPPYKRDVDRIVHSKGYSRYVDKTQVVYLVANDHVTHRGLHVQLVSNFSRGIAEVLGLNVDLVEAVALGHDVGHCPFGHEGEDYLSEISQEAGCGVFAHPLQACRLFDEIEPLNLGLYVLDGFLCHDGGLSGLELFPVGPKSWEEHMAERKRKQEDPNQNIFPATLEGCLVKLCDTMSYLGKDLEDAIQLRILTRDEVPDTPLGNTNASILTALAKDVIHHSQGKNCIALSEEAYASLKVLRQFNFERIYQHPQLKVESKKIRRSYRILFETLLDDYCREQDESHLYRDFLETKRERYLEETSDAQKVIDYIAGMTDSFFVATLEKLILPSKIEF